MLLIGLFDLGCTTSWGSSVRILGLLILKLNLSMSLHEVHIDSFRGWLNPVITKSSGFGLLGWLVSRVIILRLHHRNLCLLLNPHHRGRLLVLNGVSLLRLLALVRLLWLIGITLLLLVRVALPIAFSRVPVTLSIIPGSSIRVEWSTPSHSIPVIIVIIPVITIVVSVVAVARRPVIDISVIVDISIFVAELTRGEIAG